MPVRKYRNKKVVRDGLTFDSVREWKRWRELILLQKAGKISDLQRQVEFELIPAQREPDTVGARGGIIKGKVIERECSYLADFVYKQNGETVVEDTKGFRTKDYTIKRKLLLYRYGIRIREV